MDDAREQARPEKLAAQHQLILNGIANRFEGEFGESFTRDTLQHYVQEPHT